jgi:hypothetical protein
MLTKRARRRARGIRREFINKEIDYLNSSLLFRHCSCYVVRASAKEVVVVASVTKNGKTTKMGEQRYRIKQVPKPIPMLGSIEASGSYAAGVIKSSTFVYAALKDFAFEGISYKPVKFTLIYQPKKGDGDFAQVNGQGMDTKAKQLLNKAKSGDRFTLTQVFATGPAGTVILPTALAIEVK